MYVAFVLYVYAVCKNKSKQEAQTINAQASIEKRYFYENTEHLSATW